MSKKLKRISVTTRPYGEFIAIRDRWAKAEPISDQMPIQFPTGAVLESFGGKCLACGDDFSPQLFRGTIVRQLPNVALIEAWGGCPSCRLLTPFLCRVRGDRGLVFENYDDTKGWSTIPSVRPLWPRIARRLANACRLLTFGIFPR